MNKFFVTLCLIYAGVWVGRITDYLYPYILAALQ